ncbi:MAG: hypothetical protein QXQ53_05455 [Candidatus Methanosuratincola sp.]
MSWIPEPLVETFIDRKDGSCRDPLSDAGSAKPEVVKRLLIECGKALPVLTVLSDETKMKEL